MVRTLRASSDSPYTLLYLNTNYLRADVSTERDGVDLSSGDSSLRVNASDVNLTIKQVTNQSP